MDLWQKVCATVNRMGGPRSPRIKPQPLAQRSSIIDLHGMTLQAAYKRTKSFLETTEYRSVVVVTGRSGQIKAEFGFWLSQIPRVTNWTEQNGGGAYLISLARPSSASS